MIVSFNFGNASRVRDAYRDYHRGVYGLPFGYCERDIYLGVLAQGENLFVSADSDDNWIGSLVAGPKFNAQDLASWLIESVLPWNYAGNIYISAQGAQPSYIDALLVILGNDYTGRIFGLFEADSDHIKPPSYKGWVKAVV